jgi:type IV secretory pathway TraG/TraD family ATPase VirD4
LSSWLVLRCSDAETSEYVSKYIGDTEVSRMTKSESTSETGGGSDSRNEQIQTQRAVMPVELQRLANLQGFFKLAGDYAICGVKLAFPKKRERRATNYAERDFIAKPMLDLIAKDAPATAPAAGGAETALLDQATAAFTQAEASEPAMAQEAEQVTTLKIRRSPLEEGPAALEDILNEMAEAYENDF